MEIENSSLAAKHTLYLHNLNEKVRRDELRQSLFILFSQFGPILDIKVKRSLMMRGQAFICFANAPDALCAKINLNDRELLSKLMRIDYAKCESRSLDPQYRSETKEDKNKKINVKEFLQKQRLKKSSKVSANNVKESKIVQENEASEERSNILFLQDLPDKVGDLIVRIYSPLPGFKEVRYIESRNIAFIEFISPSYAQIALNSLNPIELKGKMIKATYSKK